MRKNQAVGALVGCYLAATCLVASAAAATPAERLGTVSFPTSCAPSIQAGFDRGVALLHDFWYAEAKPQFERVLKRDPHCAMAHWGIAMSVFHQIWDRPDEAAKAFGWSELSAAEAHPPKTSRERAYIGALAAFFRPGPASYEVRIQAYSEAMGRLYAAHPGDVDAGAFYALSLLAAEAPSDTSLEQERAAMAVLTPLWDRYPDHPGLVHYIIHACDNPSLAPDGLAAARAYGKVAPSGPHAVHMPGHIFSRLGLWPEDIAANTASVDASRAAEMRHESGWMDQFHSDDFLVYAYLQSGQDAKAQAIVAEAAALIAQYETMPGMSPGHSMAGMFPYYLVKLPIFVDLETRAWAKVVEVEPIQGAPPDTQTQVFWARAIAAGHLHHAADAHSDLAGYDALIEEIRKGPLAYLAAGTATKIRRGEILAWTSFADGRTEDALAAMRGSADLQDLVGQGEVDIPAREMLADMLRDAGRPAEALVEYRQALKLSPNRFNGLFGAGMAAETAGDAAAARSYYTALLESAGGAGGSARPELAHAKEFVETAAPGAPPAAHSAALSEAMSMT
jgi:tetratricopeptide (TPR) repeat protein